MPIMPPELLKSITADILASSPTPFFGPSLLEMIVGSNVQYVRYDASVDRVVYEDRGTFYDLVEKSPSDSRWMVPKCP